MLTKEWKKRVEFGNKNRVPTKTSPASNLVLIWYVEAFLEEANVLFQQLREVLFSPFYSQIISHRNYITDLISDTLGFLWSSRTYLKRASVILIGKYNSILNF